MSENDIRLLFETASRKYGIARYISKRGTFAKVEFYLNSEKIGCIELNKCSKDTFQVWYAKHKADDNLGKMLYYIAFDLVYPFYVIPDEVHSSEADRVWNAIYQCLGLKDKVRFKFSDIRQEQIGK